MPRIFPGMDPYLEGDLWASVHLDLSAEIVRILAPRLRPKYYVLSGHRFALAVTNRNGNPGDRIPDVAVTGGQQSRREPATTTAGPAPMVSTAIRADAELQVTIEIIDKERRRLVTAIEVLSPANKILPGLRDYAAKRNYYLHSSAHLLEIDLLRVGQRFPVADPLPPEPYFVFLSRADRRPEAEIWPIALQAPLPTVPIPLLPEDADESLDLNRAFETLFEAIGYDGLIDYRLPPPGPLTPEQAAWIDERLRIASRR